MIKNIIIGFIGINIIVFSASCLNSSSNKKNLVASLKATVEVTKIENNIDFSTVAKADAWDIYLTIIEDVFRLYNLEQYDTDLKKKVFTGTEEYKQKLLEIRNKKNKIAATTYKITIETPFENNPYNIEENAFLIRTCSNAGIGTMGASTFETINGKFYFPNFNYVKKEYIDAYTKIDETYTQYLKVRVSEQLALQIENNPSFFDVVITFNVTGTDKVSFPYLNMYVNGSMEWLKISNNIITVSNEQIHIVKK